MSEPLSLAARLARVIALRGMIDAGLSSAERQRGIYFAANLDEIRAILTPHVGARAWRAVLRESAHAAPARSTISRVRGRPRRLFGVCRRRCWFVRHFNRFFVHHHFPRVRTPFQRRAHPAPAATMPPGPSAHAVFHHRAPDRARCPAMVAGLPARSSPGRQETAASSQTESGAPLFPYGPLPLSSLGLRAVSKSGC